MDCRINYVPRDSDNIPQINQIRCLSNYKMPVYKPTERQKYKLKQHKIDRDRIMIWYLGNYVSTVSSDEVASPIPGEIVNFGNLSMDMIYQIMEQGTYGGIPGGNFAANMAGLANHQQELINMGLLPAVGPVSEMSFGSAASSDVDVGPASAVSSLGDNTPEEIEELIQNASVSLNMDVNDVKDQIQEIRNTNAILNIRDAVEILLAINQQ